MPGFQENIDAVSKAEQLVRFRQQFTLDPKQMRGIDLPVQLKWQTIRFLKSNISQVAKLPGVYAFAISHQHGDLPPHSYVLYIGQTGAKPNERSLRARIGDYFREPKSPKRAHIYKLLKTWKTCLLFHFAPIDRKATDILEIERKLNDALLPPYSVGDFSPEIRKAKRILELS
jgi:hypothetical protein